MGSITANGDGNSVTNNNNISHNKDNVWYVCKYCRRAYQQKHLLIEHKKTKHVDLTAKAAHERKLAKKKSDESDKGAETGNDATSGAEASDTGNGNNNSIEHQQEEAGSYHSIIANEEQRSSMSSPQDERSSSPVLASLEAAEAKPNMEELEYRKRGESDTEIEVVFDSHRPLASPMKPLSPCTVTDENHYQQERRTPTPMSARKPKKRRRTALSPNSRSSSGSSEKRRRRTTSEIISWDTSPDYANISTVSEIIAKVSVLGRYRYCNKCIKIFRRFSTFRAHKKLCHQKQFSSLEEFKAKYHVELQKRNESFQYPMLVKTKTPSESEKGKKDFQLPAADFVKNTCNICHFRFNDKNFFICHLKEHLLLNNVYILKRKVIPGTKAESYWSKIQNLQSKCTGLGYRQYLHTQLSIHDQNKLRPMSCAKCLPKKRSIRRAIARSQYFPFHTRGRVFLCPFCPHKAQVKSDFNAHIKYNHQRVQQKRKNTAKRSSKKFKSFYQEDCLVNCKLCYKAFFNMHSLVDHLRNHSFSPIHLNSE